MSQIFCVRRENSIGLAVISKANNGSIVLIDTYHAVSSDVEDFPDVLNSLINKHDVREIYVSPVDEGEPQPSQLYEFKLVSDKTEVKSMPYLPKAISGRMARAGLLKAGLLNENSFYAQSEKLSERVRLIKGDENTPADIHAYLAALVLAKEDEIEDADDFIGSIEVTTERDPHVTQTAYGEFRAL